MKKLLPIILLSLFVNSSVLAQKSHKLWVDGYVIPRNDNTKLGNDTVFGKIRISKNKVGAEFYKIELQMQNDETIKIQASEIISFQRGTQFFKSGFFDNNYSFAERIIHGPISLYSNKQISYEIGMWNSNQGPKWNSTMNQLGDDIIFYIEDSTSKKMIAIPSRHKKFVEFMEMYIKDNKELMSLIVNKELKSKNIVEIINLYNTSCVNKEE